MPGQPVILDELGGLVSTARPEDLPEGASPRTWDTDFIVGRFVQRPGEKNVYSYEGGSYGPRGGGSAVDIDTQGNPWANPSNILANDGSYAVATLANPTLSIFSIQVYTQFPPPSGSPVLTAIVTFATIPPAISLGQAYLFSGLTNATALNGQSLIPNSISGTTVTFAQFSGPTTNYTGLETGSAEVSGVTSFVSDNLQVTGFGFSIPSTASITGFGVSVKGYSPGATLYAQMLQGGAPVGSIKSIALPTSNAFVTLGGQTDPWGAMWTYAQVDASNFGVLLWVESSSPVSAFLDYAEITVYGTPSSVNFNGLADVELDQADQQTIALDADGQSWTEDVTNAPNVLALNSTIPVVPAGSYLKGLDAKGTAFMAYSDLQQGTSQPMQYNGRWTDRITQVGPGAGPSFAASQQAGTQCTISAYSYSSGILTLTTSVQAYVAGEVVTFSGFAGALVPLNGLTFTVLGTGLTATQIEISTSLVTGSGSDSGVATPQFNYPIVASPTGITQPAQMIWTFAYFLQSSGPGSSTPGNVITIYYGDSTVDVADADLVAAFNSGNPVYLYLSFTGTPIPFGPSVVQVTAIGEDSPPSQPRKFFYFCFIVPSEAYTYFQGSGHGSYTATYQRTQATLTTTTPVPSLEAGNVVSLSGVTASGWDGTYPIVEDLNSGEFTITQTQVQNGVATYTWSLVSGSAPAAGELVTVINTLNANGLLNVTDAVIATASGVSSGTFTVNLPGTQNFPVTVEAGIGTTAGTQFLIDPGTALVGSFNQSPIFGNSGGGLLTVVGSSSGGTFPIGAGTRQGVVFFITRNGAVTRPSPAALVSSATFTVATGANYITASNIPIGPPNVVARGIAFTEAGQNGVPGANFYTYDVPEVFTVSGVQFTASALIVPDNTTTTMKFTFSDAVLLGSDEIDIPGNNYFNLMELGNPVWMFQYANRMLYGLCQSKIQNFLNISFDGGYLPTYSTTLPMPLGWTAPTNGNLSAYTITGFSITSNVVTFQAVNSLLPGLQIVVQGLSTGTYLNNVIMVVISSNGTSFTAAFSHANVGSTTDSGTVNILSSSIGLVPSLDFGNAFQMLNLGSSEWTDATVLFQSAYQDAYNVAILQPNTAYSVRVKARALGTDNQQATIQLLPFAGGSFGTEIASATFTFQQGTYQIETAALLTGDGLAVIPTSLVIALGIAGAPIGSGVEVDRIEVFPTNNPTDITTIWESYAGSFESVDEVSGQLGVGDENPQPAVGAFELFEQLYIEKTKSLCVTQDSPNYEPDQWQVRQANDRVGAVGPNAFYEGEEFTISASRSGLFFFDGGKPMPISRELQSTAVSGSIWETINWNAGSTIWVRNDFINRRLLIGVPMTVPNFWLPNASPLTPTSPNVILMCNYTGCPTGEELAASSEVHITMFGDLKALDMRRKWAIWQIPCPIAEFIARPDGFTDQLLLCNGINSSKIYQLMNGAASGGQNTDDGAAINWDYVTYGFVKAKQGQQQPGLGALRKVWYYFVATAEGIGQVARKFYSNSLGALPQNTYTAPPMTLTYPQQNDQECVLEIGGQRLFIEFSSVGSGGYAEVGPVMLDGEMDKNAPHRGVSS
jgi:hypothetical protein